MAIVDRRGTPTPLVAQRRFITWYWVFLIVATTALLFWILTRSRGGPVEPGPNETLEQREPPARGEESPGAPRE
jgi:hypothetical protein